MPGTTGSGGATGDSPGGGSTSNICTISPSDQVAIVNNLISRISDIEKFLSQLVAADVYAGNLSELADNLGNILNGTIMLPGDVYGSGSSIPVPDDFTGTYISGNVITIWENGVVTFQVIPGSGVVTSLLPTARFIVSGGAIAAGPGGTNLTFTNYSDQMSYIINNGSTLTFQSGLYLLTADGLGSARTSTSGASGIVVRISNSVDSTLGMQFDGYWESGEVTTSRKTISGATLVRFPGSLGGNTITAFASKTGSPTVILSTTELGVIRIGP